MQPSALQCLMSFRTPHINGTLVTIKYKFLTKMKFLLILVAAIQSICLWAQDDSIFYENEYYMITDSIVLNNKSFEQVTKWPSGNTSNTLKPSYWFDCGLVDFPKESPITVHVKGSEDQFNVQHVSVHGDVFISMVTRETESFERISQRLNYELEEDTLYMMKFYIANSFTLESPIENYLETTKVFDNAVRLVLWGGYVICEYDDELFVSNDLLDEEWHELQAIFKPQMDCEGITIEVYYSSDGRYTNGNLLIDSLSNIYILNQSRTGH